MNLAAALAPFFATAVRRRGESYVREGCVFILHGDRDSVAASVTGTSLYAVELERQARRLVVSCTCPFHVRELEPCKHIWAVLLVASSRGYLVAPGGPAPLDIAAAGAAAWSGEGGRDAADAHDDDDDGPSAAAVHRQERRERPERPERRGWLPPAHLRPQGPPAVPASPRRPAPPQPPAWRDLVARAASGPPPPAVTAPVPVPVEELQYAINVPATNAGSALVVELLERGRKPGGGWTKPRPPHLSRQWLAVRLPLETDRRIVAMLAGAQARRSTPAYWQAAGSYYDPYDSLPTNVDVPSELAPMLVPMLCASGRAWLRFSPQDLDGPPLAWDGGEPWQLRLEVRRDAATASYVLEGSLRRGEERMPLDEPALLLASGLVFTADRAARLDLAGGFGWIALLRRVVRVHVPERDGGELLGMLLAQGVAPPVEVPPELRYEEVRTAPVPRLLLLAPPAGAAGGAWQPAQLSFLYGALEAFPGGPERGLYRPADRTLMLRDRTAETNARLRLGELGFQAAAAAGRGGPAGLRCERIQAGRAVRELVAAGWLVEAEGRRLRTAGGAHLGVSSKLDWFELRGDVDFGGETASLPELLAALRRGDGTVQLGDGSLGLLPEVWLRRLAPLAGLGKPEGDHLRFHATQAALLDALLEAEPASSSIACDAAFSRARERLARFRGVEPAAAPRGFRGKLRPYQSAGLGWLRFLRELGFGGCLADDMGLGKTVQVLALLESRRTQRRRRVHAPSLVVVPRSLVFNWMAEAGRFTPGLRLLNHTGTGRAQDAATAFAEVDLVLTTYGTLRRDVAWLSRAAFDYIVLDEAQAIKNPDSQSAKAARRLQGEHRLALTGTPVENHLGDLWSLLEFLNPGITGASSLLSAGGGALRNPDAATRTVLARALRPFIQRRTKEQVAADLPQKIEQTVFCELPPRQRQLYDELRRHYRAALGARLDERGLGRSKILVLEALLRLRQAACHPGLLARERAGDTGAKLEFLLPQLAEVLDEGHKALVFSQFTSFLAILRHHLDRAGTPYAYLDGRTRDRAARVAEFQTQPGCKLFLISLKAGGLGLNLTAADYVYLLDPWWNPAVEAQAIDRAHRIGQARQVFAYRIVAKDTVEEKILQLQQSKRELADAIVAADDSLLRRLTREDLELLLS
jgi:hypothetical protein